MLHPEDLEDPKVKVEKPKVKPTPTPTVSKPKTVKMAMTEDQVKAMMEGMMKMFDDTLKRTLEAGAKTKVEPPKVNMPMFKGKPSEDPNIHILRAADYFNSQGIPPKDYAQWFRLTLDAEPRQWIDECPHKENWEAVSKEFKLRFSKFGRSQRQLLLKWKSLSFDPETDSAESFIRDVKATAAQLKYGEDVVLDTIKNSLPPPVQLSLHAIKSVAEITPLLIETYPGPTAPAASSTAAGAFAIHTPQLEPQQF